MIVDLFSRFVVGWSISAVNDRHLTIKALDMALRRRCPGAGLLHHSDQGCTYASEDYQELLAAHGITCSMSRRGNCYDNAAMESWNSTLKSELGERFESYATAREQLVDYIELQPASTTPSGAGAGTLLDGTHVILLYARDSAGLAAEIDRVTFAE